MTERDKKILLFLSQSRIATRKQIQDILFQDTCMYVPIRRLKVLADNKLLSRAYYKLENKSICYVYYLDKKPSKKRIKHELLITEFVVQLIKNGYEIISFEKNKTVAGIIPDAEIKFKSIESDKIYSLFLEIQLSDHDCIKKYFNIRQKAKREIPAMLYIVTDKKINIQKLRDLDIVLDNLEMKKIKETFK